MKFAPDAMLAPAPRRARERAPEAGRRLCRVLTHTHTYSGRDDHGGTIAPPESYRRLAEWVRAHGIDAVGMGSPYTPATAETQHRYDGVDRDAYYGGLLPTQPLRQLDEVEQMLGELHGLAGDDCLFYLDNETPKGRYGHLWWIGYHADAPPWHDYDQPFDRWMLEDSDPADDADEPVAYERRPYSQIVALQRARGALGMWAHPTSWWRDDSGRFITNIASELPAHAAAEGGVDGMVVMGYQPYRPSYQALWFALLDRGYRVPGVAEMDCGLSSEQTWSSDCLMLNHVDVGDRSLTLPAITQAFRNGRVSVSSGPQLELRVDRTPMGGATRTAKHRVHHVEITVFCDPDERLSRVELVERGGAVLWSANDVGCGTLRLPIAGSDLRGYLIARAFGTARPGVTDHRRFRTFAITNPVYLHPAGEGFARGVTTRVRVELAPGSRFHSGEVRFEDAAGELLERGRLTGGGAEAFVLGTGRVTVVAADGSSRRTDYLINANPRVQALQRHLYRGRFLRDFPTLAAGDVPPAAWQLDEFPNAMGELTLAV